MSLVVFPFKDEEPHVVAANLRTAATHHRVDEVWAVAAVGSRHAGEVAAAAAEIGSDARIPVRVLPEQRIGSYRPGKGDAMNTAIRLAADEDRERIHFYDADITNFDHGWISGAEGAADRGFGAVRHRFPRAATDAMITWMVTRPSLALFFPGTFLPRLDQPLGGELLLTAPALQALAASPLVAARSDWGIDTVITYSISVLGLGLYEHSVADGKRHSLYGSLDELRDMVLECLDAVIEVGELPGPTPGAIHESDPPAEAPADLTRTVAYDPAPSRALLAEPMAPGESALIDALPDGVAGPLRRQMEPPHPPSIDATTWLHALRVLHEGFRLGDPAWESLAFRLWVARVLSHTESEVPRGYHHALAHLEATIHQYEASVDQP